MARPKTQLNRRTDIIEAAQRLFTEKGFEKATIGEIAALIKISKGSIYLDFKNKDEILLAIIERNVNSFIDSLEADIKDIKEPYLKVLRQVLQKNILHVFDMATSQIHTHIALIHTSYNIKKELNHLIQRWYEIIASVMKKAQENGEIKYYDNYNYLAQLIFISLHGSFSPL